MLKSLLEEESDLVVFMFREDNRCYMTILGDKQGHLLDRVKFGF
jgi:hypothetical protein